MNTTPAPMKVLQLNADYSVMALISWKRAVVMMMNEIADGPANFEDFHQIRGAHSSVFPVPTVIIMKKFKKARRKPTPPINKRNLWIRDEKKCGYCGVLLKWSEATVDHIHPESKGGKYSWSNCVTSCTYCNTKKSNKLLSESGMKLIRGMPKAPTLDLILSHEIALHYRPSWSWFIEAPK